MAHFDLNTPSDQNKNNFSIYQMAAVHKADMSMLGSIYKEDGVDLDICEKYVNLANKLIKTYQSGLQTFNQAKTAGKQTIVVKHQNVQVNGG
jgi:hypothetical protein